MKQVNQGAVDKVREAVAAGKTIQQAAETAGVSPVTVYVWKRKGLLSGAAKNTDAPKNAAGRGRRATRKVAPAARDVEWSFGALVQKQVQKSLRELLPGELRSLLSA